MTTWNGCRMKTYLFAGQEASENFLRIVKLEGRWVEAASTEEYGR